MHKLRGILNFNTTVIYSNRCTKYHFTLKKPNNRPRVETENNLNFY